MLGRSQRERREKKRRIAEGGEEAVVIDYKRRLGLGTNYVHGEIRDYGIHPYQWQMETRRRGRGRLVALCSLALSGMEPVIQLWRAFRAFRESGIGEARQWGFGLIRASGADSTKGVFEVE
jgi:hypothetical protein